MTPLPTIDEEEKTNPLNVGGFIELSSIMENSSLSSVISSSNSSFHLFKCEGLNPK